MKRAGWFTRAAVALALSGIMLPQLATAEMPAPHPVSRSAAQPLRPAAAPTGPAIADVALGTGGVLKGRVVDPQGLALPQVNVAVRQNERTVATALTDNEGRFAVSGLGGGMYLIVAGSGTAVYRLWAPQTAPPAAMSSAVVISGQQQVVRGQSNPGGLRYWLTNPWILAGLIGAAIVVPIALNNTEKVSTS